MNLRYVRYATMHCFACLLCALVGSSALAANESAQTFTLDGQLYRKGTTTPLTDSNVSLKLQILDPTKSCVLYEEQQTVDTSASAGRFNVQLGSSFPNAKRTGGDPGNAMGTVFQNNAAIPGVSVPGQTCTGNSFSPASGDTRYVRITVTPSSTGVADTLSPDMTVDSVPTALVADSVQGLDRSNILSVRDDASYVLSQPNLENVFSNANYAALTALLNGTSTAYMPLNGTSPYNFNNQRLINVAAPGTSPFDAVNKGYADAYIGGKDTDLTSIGPGIGGGSTLIWDQAQNKWVAGNPIGNTGVAAGTYGSSTQVPVFTVGADGRLTAAYGTTISGVTPGGAAGGDLTGSYPNPQINADAVTTAKIINDAVTSAKVNSSGVAVNRLVATDAATGSSLTYFSCNNLDEIMKWTASGWSCSTVASLSPVKTVASKTPDAAGNIALNAADIAGLLSAALKDYGTAAGQLVELDGTGRIPAALLPATSGTITAVTALAPLLGGGTSGNVNVSIDVGTAANQVVRFNGTAQYPGNDGSLIQNVNAVKLQGRALSSNNPTASQVLGYNASLNEWEPMSTAVGSVTAVVSGAGLIPGTVTSQGTINVDVGSTAGKIVRLDASGKFDVIDGSNLTGINAVTLQSRPVASYTPATNQILTWNGSHWEPANASSSLAWPLVANPGTAAPTAPQYTFAGSTDTGLLSQSAGSLALATYGTTRLTVTSTGDVGVGTTSPLSPLHISTSNADGRNYLDVYSGASAPLAGFVTRVARGTSAAPAGIQNGDTMATVSARGYGSTGFSSGSRATISMFSSESWTDTAQGAFITFSTTPTGATSISERMRIDPSGNVGIGTTTPGRMLDIGGGQGTVVGIRGSANNQLNISRATNAGYGLLLTNSDGTGGGYHTSTSGANNPAAVVNVQNDALHLGTNNLVRATIDHSGNVGIGTTAPGNPLQIVTSGGTPLNVQSSNVASVTTLETTSTTASAFNQLEFKTPGGSSASIYGQRVGTTNNGQLLFYTETSGTSSEKVRIDSSGNVGIGTTSPTAALTVNGGQGAFTGLTAQANNQNGLIVFGGTNGGSVFARGDASGGDDNLLLKAFNEIQLNTFVGGVDTTQVTIKNNGNIGIGTTSPLAGLDVSTTGTGASAIIVPRDTTANRPSGVNGMIRYNTSSNNIEGYANGAWSPIIGASGSGGIWSLNASNAYYNGGNVGVGTTSPIGKLEVSDVDTSTTLKIENRNSSSPRYPGVVISNFRGATTGHPYLSFQLAGGDSSAPTAIGSSTLFRIMGDGYDGSSYVNGAQIVAATEAGWSFGNTPAALMFNTNPGSGNLERMRITGAGNVGIGTTSPAANLDVLSGLTTVAILRSSNTASLVNFVDSVSSGSSESIGSNGANGIQIITDGSTRGTFDSVGNLGVGTTTPRSILELASTGTNSALLVPRDTTANRPAGNATNGMVRYNTNTNKFEFYENAQWMTYGTTGAGSSQWTTSGSDIYYNSGNVGVGTTSPAEKLEVDGYGKFGYVAIGGGGPGSGTPKGNNNYVNFGATQNGALFIGSNLYEDAAQNIKISNTHSTMAGAAIHIPGNSEARQGSIQFWTTTPASVTADAAFAQSAPRMIIDTSGNIGIGTTSPSEKFHVSGGNVRLDTSKVLNWNTGNTFIGDTISPDHLRVAGYYGVDLYAAVNTGDFTFTNNQTGQLMVVKGTGNVGIGTTNPLSGLDVSTTGTGASAIIIPRDTTANRPSGVNGMIRYNTNSSNIEGFANGTWSPIIGASGSGGIWSLNGSNAYYNGGNVGVGTTAPSEKLETSTALFTNVIVGTNSSNSAKRLGLYYDTGNTKAVIDANANHLALQTLGLDRVFISSAGNVGVGTTSPQFPLDVSSASNPIIGISSYSNSAFSAPGLNLYRGRGDSATPTALQSGDRIGGIGFNGYDGTAMSPNAAILTYAEENFTPTTRGARVQFETTALGSASRTEKMRITGNGNVGVGTTSPQAGLDVATTGTAGSAIIVPRDSTANRPTAATNGMIRYNTSTSKFEFYENNNWVTYGTSGAPATLSFPLLASPGTASPSAPSFSFTGSATTGMFAPATGTLAFSTNAAERVRIDGSGYVGIGTDAPRSMVDIAASGSGTWHSGSISLTDTSNNNAWMFANRGSLDTGNQDKLITFFYNGGSYVPMMTLDTSGKVGIGTTAPESMLTVISADNSEGIFVGSPGYVNPGEGPSIGFSGGPFPNWRTASIKGIRLGLNAEGGLVFATNTGGAGVGTGPIERMRIDNGGNVGIGTTSPARKLHVVDSAGGELVAAGNGAANETVLRMGVDSGNNGWIQATHTNISQIPLMLNSAGGAVGIGVASLDTNNTMTIGGGISINTYSNDYNNGVRIHPSTNNDESTVVLGAVAGGVGTGVGQWTLLRKSAANNNLFSIRHNSTDALNITTAGNVGMGTTSPQSALEIAVTGTNSALLVPRDTTANRPTGNATNGMIRYNSNTNKFEFYENAQWVNYGTGAGGGTPAGSDKQIQFNNSGSFGASSSFTWNNTVGTLITGSAPGWSASENALILNKSASNNKIKLLNSSSGAGSNTVGVEFSMTSQDARVWNYQSSGALLLGTNDAERVRINSSGNVGIGTTAPSAALDVYGGAGVGAINIGGTNGISYPATDSTPSGSVAVGSGALQHQSALGSAAFSNTAVGYQTLASNSMTTAATNNTAIGYQALAVTTSGSGNTAVGRGALDSNTTGAYNSAVGASALSGNTSGSYNNAMGELALGSNSTGTWNVAIGQQALSASNSSYNTAIGGSALSASSGSGNTALGRFAGGDVTSGSYNIMIGYYDTGGVGITTGSSNILIGNDIRPASQTASNQLNIGNLLYATGLGSGATLSTGNVGIGTTSPAAKLEIQGSSGSTLKIVDGNQGSGKVLTSDANGQASWQSAGGGGSGSLVKISTLTANNSSDLTWTGLDATYDTLVLTCNAIIPVTTATSFGMDWGQGAGPTWLSGSNYIYNTVLSGSSSGGTGTVFYLSGVAGDVSNVAGVQYSGRFEIYNVGSSSVYKSFLGTVVYATASSSIKTGTVGGFNNVDTNPITAIRLKFSSGNIASGKCTLFGMVP